MKKFVNIIISVLLFSNMVFADCDFSKDITKNPDGNYTYTKDCHIKVGEMKQDLEISNKKIENLMKVASLKDLALEKADKRADLWMGTAFKLEDRINSIDQMRKSNEMMYFTLGALTVFAAGVAAAQLTRR